MTRLNQTQEVVLSYLTGLCGIGDPVSIVRMSWIADDMGLSQSAVSRSIAGLRKAGNIELSGCGACFYKFRVLRRIEHVAATG